MFIDRISINAVFKITYKIWKETVFESDKICFLFLLNKVERTINSVELFQIYLQYGINQCLTKIKDIQVWVC